MSNEFSRLDKYDVLIRRKPGKVSAGIPALGLFVTAADAHVALNALDERKRQLEADLIAADMTDLLEDKENYGIGPAGPAMRSGDLRRFTIKTFIVVALITGAVVASGAFLAIELNGAVDKARQMTKIGGSSFWSKVEEEIIRATDPKTDLPDAKKQQLLANIRVIVKRWQPFVAEIAPLFSDQQGANDRNQKRARDISE